MRDPNSQDDRLMVVWQGDWKNFNPNKLLVAGRQPDFNKERIWLRPTPAAGVTSRRLFRVRVFDKNHLEIYPESIHPVILESIPLGECGDFDDPMYVELKPEATVIPAPAATVSKNVSTAAIPKN